MFNTNAPGNLDKNIEEGTVTEVDAKRMICKVHTVFGKKLTRVRWLLQYGGSSRGGDRGTPSQGDRVVLNYGLGYPLITGFLPEMGEDRDDSTEIVGESFSVDTGNFTGVAGDDSKIDISKPKDFLSGDRIISTLGGAVLGVLRGGSLLFRSGPFSEIFISKFMNLVRIVSGNWEHYTDGCSDVIKNYKGRVYRYTGYTNTYLDSKTEKYSYHVYTGDTALAEEVKTSYHTTLGTLPVVDTVIHKEQVKTVSGETMSRTLNLDGSEETIVTNLGGVTKVRSNGTEVYVSHNDDNWIKINEGGITLMDSSGATVTLSGNTVSMDDAAGGSVQASGGVISVNGATTVNVGASTSVTVTSPLINLVGAVSIG